jgi:hypothetical protein
VFFAELSEFVGEFSNVVEGADGVSGGQGYSRLHDICDYAVNAAFEANARDLARVGGN